MIQIGEVIVSREVLENKFICHLEKCEGSCCVHGDAGAPLEKGETKLLERHQGELKPYLRQEGLDAIDGEGSWVFDSDGDRVTPLVNGEECAYAIFEGNSARCGIEKAWEAGAIELQKPVSCHLYPIRVSKLKNAKALNYHQWHICEPARFLGRNMEMPVFRFLKDAIIRVFGRNFYDELENAHMELLRNQSSIKPQTDNHAH